MILEPGVVALDGERPDEPQAALGIREDTHHISAPPDLLISSLSRSSMLVDFMCFLCASGRRK